MDLNGFNLPIGAKPIRLMSLMRFILSLSGALGQVLPQTSAILRCNSSCARRRQGFHPISHSKFTSKRWHQPRPRSVAAVVTEQSRNEKRVLAYSSQKGGGDAQ